MTNFREITYFFTPISHKLLERTSEFVHIEISGTVPSSARADASGMTVRMSVTMAVRMSIRVGMGMGMSYANE